MSAAYYRKEIRRYANRPKWETIVDFPAGPYYYQFETLVSAVICLRILRHKYKRWGATFAIQEVK